MIDREKFESNFVYYGKEVIVQIIDIFLDEFDGRMANLSKNVSERDFNNIKFNAHSLKGTIANFMDPESVALARRLEEMAMNMQVEELDEVMSNLLLASGSLVMELLEYRRVLST